MKSDNDWADELEWHCADCGRPLELGQVTVTYMENSFTTDMPHCAHCGAVLVPEELALGKMAEVEKILEDK
jgi:hypothetical protein